MGTPFHGHVPTIFGGPSYGQESGYCHDDDAYSFRLYR